MMTIGKLSKVFGFSRSTLLYYDKIGLIRPSARSKSGYRLYNDKDVSRLEQIIILRNPVPVSLMIECTCFILKRLLHLF